MSQREKRQRRQQDNTTTTTSHCLHHLLSPRLPQPLFPHPSATQTLLQIPSFPAMAFYTITPHHHHQPKSSKMIHSPPIPNDNNFHQPSPHLHTLPISPAWGVPACASQTVQAILCKVEELIPQNTPNFVSPSLAQHCRHS